MSDQLVPNAFGEMVLHRVTVPKVKIKDMSPEERKHYNAEKQQKSRDKKKLVEEIADEAKRLSEQHRPQEEYQAREAERTAKSTPWDWEDTIHEKVQPIITAILGELKEHYYPPRRIEGNLIPGLHGIVREHIFNLGAIVFGSDMAQLDGLGFRQCGVFCDAAMHQVVLLDKNILEKSKTFKSFYSDAVRATVKLAENKKYQAYLEWMPSIRQELTRISEEIEFSK
jgi:hypothetical protein